MSIYTLRTELDTLLKRTNTDFVDYKITEKEIIFTISDKYLKIKDLIGDVAVKDGRGPRHVVATEDIQLFRNAVIPIKFDDNGLCLPYNNKTLDFDKFMTEVTSGRKKRPLGELEEHVKHIMDSINSQVFSTVAVLAFTKQLGKQFKLKYSFMYDDDANMPDGRAYFGILESSGRKVFLWTQGCELIASLSYNHSYPDHIIHSYEYFRCPMSYFKMGIGLALGASQSIVKLFTCPYELVSVRHLYDDSNNLLAYRLKTKSGTYDIGKDIMDSVSKESQKYFCFTGSSTLRLRNNQWITRSEESSKVCIENISLDTKRCMKILRNVGYRQ